MSSEMLTSEEEIQKAADKAAAESKEETGEGVGVTTGAGAGAIADAGAACVVPVPVEVSDPVGVACRVSGPFNPFAFSASDD